MNRLLIVLILLLSLSSKGFSQRPYGIYLPGDNCLLYSSYDMDGNWMGEYIYLRNGETELIEGKEYNKVYYENRPNRKKSRNRQLLYSTPHEAGGEEDSCEVR